MIKKLLNFILIGFTAVLILGTLTVTPVYADHCEYEQWGICVIRGSHEPAILPSETFPDPSDQPVIVPPPAFPDVGGRGYCADNPDDRDNCPPSSPDPTPAPAAPASPPQGGGTAPPPAAPAAVYTTHYRIAESPSELGQADWIAYTAHPLKINYTFPLDFSHLMGVRVLFVQFKNSNGEISEPGSDSVTLTAPLSARFSSQSVAGVVNSPLSLLWAQINIPQGRSLRKAEVLVTKEIGGAGQLISNCPQSNIVGSVYCRIGSTTTERQLNVNWTPSETGTYVVIVSVEDSTYQNNPESNGLCASNPYVSYPYRFGDNGKFIDCGGDLARIRVSVGGSTVSSPITSPPAACNNQCSTVGESSGAFVCVSDQGDKRWRLPQCTGNSNCNCTATTI